MADESRRQFTDALDILTDENLRTALHERRELLKGRLASFVVDEMMPGFVESEQHQVNKHTIMEAISSIDARLDGAAKLLRRPLEPPASEDTVAKSE